MVETGVDAIIHVVPHGWQHVLWSTSRSIKWKHYHAKRQHVSMFTCGAPWVATHIREYLRCDIAMMLAHIKSYLNMWCPMGGNTCLKVQQWYPLEICTTYARRGICFQPCLYENHFHTEKANNTLQLKVRWKNQHGVRQYLVWLFLRLLDSDVFAYDSLFDCFYRSLLFTISLLKVSVAVSW